MNDDFLTRFRKAPPREFSEALYERIRTEMKTQQNFKIRRMTFAAAICLAVIAALTFSPSARAAINGLVQQIGGITFLGPEDTADQAPVPESQVTIVPEDWLSLDKARGKVPFEISLPTWAPDGFTMSKTVRISYFGDRYTPVEITWYGSDATVGNIVLTVGQPVNWLVDMDHLEEVQINGEPAGLTGGSWDADSGQWSGSAATLTWKKGDVMYTLSSPGAPVEDLIRMAESIP
jgi:uncharacterized protein DUF4367